MAVNKIVLRCGNCNEEFETFLGVKTHKVLENTPFERFQFFCEECEKK